ncbi:esterase-like activity of phytase family protein [Sphingomonas sp.]|uniref:esterase-like activity of phytase family protein n=1 Tax=Sphingomonas sp. TaxID=28214 RepID=UPI0035C8005E
MLAGGRRASGYERRRVRLLLSILLVLMFVPTWSGEVRLPLLDRDAKLTAVRLPLAQRRYGRLTLIGVYRLSSEAPAFGGFSAIALHQGRLVLLNDGGNWVSFAIRHGRPIDALMGFLPDGPRIGWEKSDRDSESLVLDPQSGRAWIGFESANAIWRYAPGLRRGDGEVRPQAMRRWRQNGGAESMARLPDGRFVVIAERGPKRRLPRPGLIFDCDPVAGCTPQRFGYRPPAGYDPSDAAALPNGDLLVLTRQWRPPVRFTAKLTLVRRADLRAGKVVTGREIATLDGPLAENWEGLAVTREGGATMLWMVSDEDEPLVQRTLLAKFRLD